MNIHDTLQALEQGAFDSCLKALYSCEDCQPYRTRLLRAVQSFQKNFEADDLTEISLFSSPARTELGGNHTDHQGGHVLTGTIQADMIAVASKQDNQEIQLFSNDLPSVCITLSDLSPQEHELHTSAGLLRGIACQFQKAGTPVTGLTIYIDSDIPVSAGLSSSGAFEMLAVSICETFFSETPLTALQKALIGQYAENVYFGKPCGLSDQLTCAEGGILAIDFQSEIPEIKKLSVDFQNEGYALCILETGSEHTDTSVYASVPDEMSSIAKMFSREKLSEISENEFKSHFSALRRTCGDRAVLRAMHYFSENKRVAQQIQALQNHDFETYLQLVKNSGHSSFAYLQNVSDFRYPERQESAVAIALCEEILDGRGAVRIHGGGFAGTIQAYVPLDFLNEFRIQAESLLRVGCCHCYTIRNTGCIAITTE